MKKIIGILLLLLGSLGHAKAQSYELTIDSIVGIPDTIVNGADVTFFMIISTNSSLFYQGDFYVELEYAGAFFESDTSFAANAALGPNLPTNIQATHRFTTDDGLNIGDNVVVVWPRIGDGQTPTQSVSNPYSRIITLIEPNGIEETSSTRISKPFLRSNPVSSTMHFHFEDMHVPIRTKVYDLSGKLVLSTDKSNNINIDFLQNGLYVVQVLMEDGNILTDRVLIAR